MIQCKDSIVILRRSEDRRRICIKVYVDRFLTALRLSFSSLLGIVRLRTMHSLRSSIRFAQNDKVGLSGWDGRSLRGTPGDSRMFADLRRPRLRPARLKEPHNASTFVAKTIVPHSPPHSFKRLLLAPAAGYRHRETGVLAEVGSFGEYWSSSTYASDVANASHLALASSKTCPVDTNGAHAYGFSVRCVQASTRSCFFSIIYKVWETECEKFFASSFRASRPATGKVMDSLEKGSSDESSNLFPRDIVTNCNRFQPVSQA